MHFVGYRAKVVELQSSKWTVMVIPPNLTHMYTDSVCCIEGHLVLESVKFPGNHVGVMENGALKAPNRTRRDRPGQFRVDVLTEQPSYHNFVCVCVCSQRTLYHGNVVVLYSRASGRTLKINDNNSIDGQGGEGALGTDTHHMIYNI